MGRGGAGVSPAIGMCVRPELPFLSPLPPAICVTAASGSSVLSVVPVSEMELVYFCPFSARRRPSPGRWRAALRKNSRLQNRDCAPSPRARPARSGADSAPHVTSPPARPARRHWGVAPPGGLAAIGCGAGSAALPPGEKCPGRSPVGRSGLGLAGGVPGRGRDRPRAGGAGGGGSRGCCPCT